VWVNDECLRHEYNTERCLSNTISQISRNHGKNSDYRCSTLTVQYSELVSLGPARLDSRKQAAQAARTVEV